MSLNILPGAFGPGGTLEDAAAWLTRAFLTDARRRWHERWTSR